MFHIEMQNVNKWYGELHVLRDINLKVTQGERIVICGPSGSGKSTMIRCINRLEEHQKGTIFVDGVELTDDLKTIDEIRREVGMVFQQFNLFPHLTILENCALLWRPAAAGGYRPLAVHDPENHVVRRTDFGAGPGNGQGSSRHHAVSSRGWHDYAVRDARDGLARQVANRVIFMSAGQIVEVTEPTAFFDTRRASALGISWPKRCTDRSRSQLARTRLPAGTNGGKCSVATIEIPGAAIHGAMRPVARQWRR